MPTALTGPYNTEKHRTQRWPYADCCTVQKTNLPKICEARENSGLTVNRGTIQRKWDFEFDCKDNRGCFIYVPSTDNLPKLYMLRPIIEEEIILRYRKYIYEHWWHPPPPWPTVEQYIIRRCITNNTPRINNETALFCTSDWVRIIR